MFRSFFGGDLPALEVDLTAENVADLGAGTIISRARRHVTGGFFPNGAPTPRWSEWSERFQFVLGSESPGALDATYRLSNSESTLPTLVWPESRTIRRFDEAELVADLLATNVSTVTANIEQTLPRYELWINDVNTNKRVLYERDLTEREFEIPSALANRQLRAWVRTIVDGDQRSKWVAPVGLRCAGRDYLILTRPCKCRSTVCSDLRWLEPRPLAFPFGIQFKPVGDHIASFQCACGRPYSQQGRMER